MACINYSEISKYVCDDNIIGHGKEVIVYYYHDKVIKIFHTDRKTSIQKISDQGLIRLTELSLNCFNTPIDLIFDGNRIVGYTEKFLKEEEPNFENINFDFIKEDLIVLSENGFCIEDLFYNYAFVDGNLCFYDLTCYSYLKTDVEFLKKCNLKKNTIIMNNFLIGLLLFGAFRKGEKSEYTKIYLANQYRLENCDDMFYGDFLKKERPKFK